MNDVDRAALRALGYRLGDDCGYQWQTTLLVLRREGAVFETARTELGRPLRLAHWGDRAYVLVGAVAYRISPLPAMGSYWYAAAVRAAA